MLKITRVDALDGDTLDVELSNGHTLLVDLSQTLKTERYASLNDGTVFCCPKTDGNCVLWRSGVSMTMETLLSMVCSECKQEVEK